MKDPRDIIEALESRYDELEENYISNFPQNILDVMEEEIMNFWPKKAPAMLKDEEGSDYFLFEINDYEETLSTLKVYIDYAEGVLIGFSWKVEEENYFDGKYPLQWMQDLEMYLGAKGFRFFESIQKYGFFRSTLD
jgi:hypothetical protein